MTKTYTTFGASLHLCLSGEPIALAAEVTRLYNYGVACGIPETFKPGEHSKVYLTSHKARWQTGWLSLAHVQIAANKDLTRTMKKRPDLFHAAVAVRADELKGEFVKGAEIVDAPDCAEIKRKIEDDEIAPWMRKAGKRILAGVSEIRAGLINDESRGK